MELITNWQDFNNALLTFCQIQGAVGMIVLAAVAIFKYDLGDRFLKRGDDSR